MTLSNIVKTGQFVGLDNLKPEEFQKELLRRLSLMEDDVKTQVDLISDELDTKANIE